MSHRPFDMWRLRRAAKRVPGLRPAYRWLREHARDARETIDLWRLRARARRPFEGDPSSNVVVSLTSFPARIRYAWIAIETIFQQRRKPAKVVLVLAEEEFPGRSLPRMIRQQEKRGLELLWVARNTRSYKKLLPTRMAYPEATIVTVDDDLVYDPGMLEELIAAADRHPGAIVGHRGWAICAAEPGRLEPYLDWPPADRSTPSARVFLTSGAGALYPPGILDDTPLLDVDLAQTLCPFGDDIWFWAMARLVGAPLVCLGNHALRPVRRLHESPSLMAVNWGAGQNDIQLQRVMQHFSLWEAGEYDKWLATPVMQASPKA